MGYCYHKEYNLGFFAVFFLKNKFLFFGGGMEIWWLPNGKTLKCTLLTQIFWNIASAVNTQCENEGCLDDILDHSKFIGGGKWWPENAGVKQNIYINIEGVLWIFRWVNYPLHPAKEGFNLRQIFQEKLSNQSWTYYMNVNSVFNFLILLI